MAFLIFILLVILTSVALTKHYYENYVIADILAAQNRLMEEQYYRGTYDVCLWLEVPQPNCQRSIPIFKVENWYDRVSPGWNWPLEIGKDRG